MTCRSPHTVLTWAFWNMLSLLHRHPSSSSEHLLYRQVPVSTFRQALSPLPRLFDVVYRNAVYPKAITALCLFAYSLLPAVSLLLNTPSTQQLICKYLINKRIEELGEVQWEMQARPRDKWHTFCGHSLSTSQSPNVSDLMTNSKLRDRTSEWWCLWGF